jgi:hypothetical protein
LLAAFAVTGGYAANVEAVPALLPSPGPIVILTAHALDGHWRIARAIWNTDHEGAF